MTTEAEPVGDLDAVVACIVGHLAATAPGRRAGRDNGWSAGAGALPGQDRVALLHGAAGPLGVLARYAWYRPDGSLLEALCDASRWVARQVGVAARPPGLLVGEAGILWAVADAGVVLEDDDLVAHSVTWARQLPVQWPAPGLASGAAGVGLALLHLWQLTGDSELRARAAAVAAGLAEAAESSWWRRRGAVWPVPPEHGGVSGGTHWGYAQGSAGIGAFLLAAGDCLAAPEYTALGCAAADVLLGAGESASGGLDWHEATERAESPAVPPASWWSGAAGIGGFLLQAWQATGDLRYLIAAERAATAVADTCPGLPMDYWCGLSGGADFLLDMAAEARGPYRDWVEGIGRALCRHLCASRSGGGGGTRLDELDADWGAGLAGVLSFLVRLRTPMPRQWSVVTGARGAARCEAGAWHSSNQGRGVAGLWR